VLEKVGHLLARVFARVDDHFGALLGPFRDVLPGIRHSVVGKRERFFRSIGGYDDELSAPFVAVQIRSRSMEKTEHILTYEHCVLQVPYGVRIFDFPRETAFFWEP
jgi:hypothetical protein